MVSYWSARHLRASRFTTLLIFFLAICYILSENSFPSGVFNILRQRESLRKQEQKDARNAAWPVEYGEVTNQSSFCENHFGVKYLENYSELSTEYCLPDDVSQLRCFTSTTDQMSLRKDMFCIGGPAELINGKFHMKCNPLMIEEEEAARGMGNLAELPFYWYETGPGRLFHEFVEIMSPNELSPSWPTERRPTTIIIKREAANTNTWHGLMEIFATFMTLDILRMTLNPATQRPYFEPEDFNNTQVLLVDNYDNGPYYQLWNMFAQKPVLRLNEIATETPSPAGNVILPIPGGANPFWQGDWVDLDCTHSTLLQTFSRRVLDFYDIQAPVKRPQLVLTFIDRRGQRRLVDQIKDMAELQLRHPELVINIIDLAAFTFAEQLNITHKSDILVGVHGAGLTHGIFLPPKSAVVEVMPFNLDHRGFRNMAKMLGHHHLRPLSRNNQTMTNAQGDWHVDDVYVDEDDLLLAIEWAIRLVKDSRATESREIGDGSWYG